MLVGLVLLCWVLSVSIIADCRFIASTTGRLSPHITYGYKWDYTEHKAGIFNYESSDSCTTDDDRETPQKWAGAFGVLAVLSLLGAFTSLLLVLVLKKAVNSLWLTFRVLSVLSCPLQAGTFTIVKKYNDRLEEPDTSLEKYWLGSTGRAAAANIFLILIAAILAWLVGPPARRGTSPAPESSKPTDQVQEQVQAEADA